MSTLNKIRDIAIRQISDRQAIATISRLDVFSASETSELQPILYEPTCCLVLQGAKRVIVGDHLTQYQAGEYFVATAEVIALGKVVVEKHNEPYVAINLTIDPTIVASVLFDMPDVIQSPLGRGFGVSRASETLLDAWLRMMQLLENPDDIPVLATLIEREILFRLLQGPLGSMLRQVAGPDSRLSNIRRVLSWIRGNYTQHILIEELAEMAGMSVSVFHRHFKAVTAMSPIQYQKNFRLHTARRHLLDRQRDIAGVAFSIGYESRSQFSREYARLFGVSPSEDVRRLRPIVSR